MVGLAGSGDTVTTEVVLLHVVAVDVKVNVTVPAEIPVTTPSLVTVAFELSLLIQVPPVVGLNVMFPPTHTSEAAVTTGRSFTITLAVELLHPVAVSVNVKLTVPADTPVTKPKTSGAAIATSLLTHDPPVDGLNDIVAPTHKTSEEVFTVGRAFTVTVGVVLLNPVDVSVNVKVTVPEVTPVTNPALLMVAIPELLLTHVPPVTGLIDIVDPTHNLSVGILTDGRSLTATELVVFEQPVAVLVKVNVTVPSDTPVIKPALVMVAMPGALLVQVPPEVGLAVIVLPT